MVRLIKLAFISFVILFLTVTAISLLIPSHIRISKAINVAPPAGDVLALIKDKNQWQQWHPVFQQKDSSTASKLNSFILKAASDSEVIYELHYKKSRPVVNGWAMHSHASTDSLTLQWYMDFNLPWYPWQKFGSLFYENTYGVMMENGLTNIKKITGK